jgi:hypothetical protein
MSPATPSAPKSFHKAPLRITGSKKSLSDAPTTTSSRNVALSASPTAATNMVRLRKVVTDLFPGASCGNILLVVAVVLLVISNLCTLWSYRWQKTNGES